VDRRRDGVTDLRIDGSKDNIRMASAQRTTGVLTNGSAIKSRKGQEEAKGVAVRQGLASGDRERASEWHWQRNSAPLMLRHKRGGRQKQKQKQQKAAEAAGRGEN
jgi:hypothetical protein